MSSLYEDLVEVLCKHGADKAILLMKRGEEIVVGGYDKKDGLPWAGAKNIEEWKDDPNYNKLADLVDQILDGDVTWPTQPGS